LSALLQQVHPTCCLANVVALQDVIKVAGRGFLHGTRATSDKSADCSQQPPACDVHALLHILLCHMDDTARSSSMMAMCWDYQYQHAAINIVKPIGVKIAGSCFR
jgi:hypothetical protein